MDILNIILDHLLPWIKNKICPITVQINDFSTDGIDTERLKAITIKNSKACKIIADSLKLVLFDDLHEYHILIYKNNIAIPEIDFLPLDIEPFSEYLLDGESVDIIELLLNEDSHYFVLNNGKKKIEIKSKNARKQLSLKKRTKKELKAYLKTLGVKYD